MRNLLVFFALVPTFAFAQVAYPPASISTLATKSEVAAVASTVPTAGTGSPTAVVDANAGTPGTAGQYAAFTHTHPSKARKGRVLVPVAGTFDVVFSNTFTTGAPLCSVTAETTAGDTNVVNAQIDGPTSMTGFRIRITRTAITVAAVLGLTILSVPNQSATYAHFICIEP